jgi:hypothetical protein
MTTHSSFEGLPVQRRVMQIVYGAVFCIGALVLVQGRPPAHGQTIAVEPVVTHTDETQDIALSKLQEFKTNQEEWNKQTGSQVGSLLRDVTYLYGGIAGIMGIAAIGVFKVRPTKGL